jgi:hypothetical protein
MRLLVIGDDDLPADHRWAILRPTGGEPVLAVKQTWSRDLRTLTEALGALPALTGDVEGVEHVFIPCRRKLAAVDGGLSMSARHPERDLLTYRR